MADDGLDGDGRLWRPAVSGSSVPRREGRRSCRRPRSPARIFRRSSTNAVSPVDEAWRAARRDALLDTSPRRRSGRDPDRAFSLRPAAVRVRADAAARSRPRLDAASPWSPARCATCSSRRSGPDARRRSSRGSAASSMPCSCTAIRRSSRSTRPFGAAEQIADLIRYTGYVAAGTATERRQLGGQGRGARLGRRRCGRRATPLRGARGAPADAARRSRVAFPDRAEPSRRRVRAARRGSRTRHDRRALPSGFRRRGSGLPRSRSRRPATTRPWTSCATSARAVVVPYETSGETEQRLRADILASKGLLTVVPEAELSPERLAAAIARGASNCRRASAAIDLSGAAATARCVHELADAAGAITPMTTW